MLKELNINELDLNNLTARSLFDFLLQVNKGVRGLDLNTNAYSDNMIAGDLFAPNREVKFKILVYLVEQIKLIPDKNTVAALMYYTIIDLHMFSDGNGRTARFVYDYISSNLSKENERFYFHRDLRKNLITDRDLERNYGIMDICSFNQIADKLLIKKINFIPKEILLKYSWITVSYCHYISIRELIPKSKLEGLSEMEIENLDIILHDSYGMYLCPSGLAMLYVAQKKNELQKWLEYNDKRFPEIPYRLTFALFQNNGLIDSWTPEDFREVIKVGNAIKFERLRCLIDCFSHPNENINEENGKRYLDEILGVNDSIKRT